MLETGVAPIVAHRHQLVQLIRDHLHQPRGDDGVDTARACSPAGARRRARLGVAGQNGRARAEGGGVLLPPRLGRPDGLQSFKYRTAD